MIEKFPYRESEPEGEHLRREGSPEKAPAKGEEIDITDKIPRTEFSPESVESHQPAKPSGDRSTENYWHGPKNPEEGFASPKEELFWLNNWFAESLNRWSSQEMDPFLLKERQKRQKELFKTVYGEDLDPNNDEFEVTWSK